VRQHAHACRQRIAAALPIGDERGQVRSGARAVLRGDRAILGGDREVVSGDLAVSRSDGEILSRASEVLRDVSESCGVDGVGGGHPAGSIAQSAGFQAELDECTRFDRGHDDVALCGDPARRRLWVRC
jgi:hypothetical protein